MLGKVWLLLALVGCSPTYYLGARAVKANNTCPTTSALLADFLLGSTALGLSVLKQTAGKDGEAVAYATGGMTIFLLANVSETACRR